MFGLPFNRITFSFGGYEVTVVDDGGEASVSITDPTGTRRYQASVVDRSLMALAGTK